jgi:CubicO group peptidase (beta-lactamase class C family)
MRAVRVTALGFLCSLSLASTLAAGTAAQQPGETDYRDDRTMPGGIAGERIQAIIRTVNSNDPQQIQRFLEEECTEAFRDFAPIEEHLEVFAGVFRRWGGAEFHSIRTYTPPREGETVVILQDRNFGAWRAITLWFDDRTEGLVAGIRFDDARTPTDVEEPPLSEEEVVQETQVLLGRVCDEDVFSGTALIARGDEVLMTHACGEASKRFHVPNNIDTKFNLGSMNKMFTATSIAQLVERGVLSYEEPIGKYVDETWLPRDITEKVTIHHLLTHTSGLGSYFNEIFMNGSRALYRDLSDFKPLVRNESLAFEPGQRYRYSNTGMLLLGVVIESATGRSYFDYVRTNIFEPAGMRDTDSYEMDQPVENLAIGYDPAPGTRTGWENNLFKHVIKGGPAGGGFSTVGDLHRFARALITGALVSQEALDRMWRDYSGEGYGYGFGIQDSPAGKVVGHSGGFPGINANLDIFSDRGYVVAVMSNYGGAASPVASRINQLIGRIAADAEGMGSEGVEITWAPDAPVQGTLFRLVVVVPNPSGVERLEAEVAGEPLHFSPASGGGYEALAPAPIDLGSNLQVPITVRYWNGSVRTIEADVPVARGQYRLERLTVAPGFGSPPDSATQERINRDRARARRVSRESHETPRLWTGEVVRPRDTPVTSGFGHGREFNGQVQSRHMGTDLRGGPGSPVRAAARGVVALVDSFYLAGNVVYLDHGEGLVSGYFHLSEALVSEGVTVEAGQLIGRVGATGRVTGPHLHWVVRYGSVSVDPLSFLALSGSSGG